MPSIVVEFVSVGKRNRARDYEAKRDEYLAAGVLEYWVIDRFRRQMTVFRHDGSRAGVAESETFRTPLLPGFELPLSRLLAEADLLEQDSTLTRSVSEGVSQGDVNLPLSLADASGDCDGLRGPPPSNQKTFHHATSCARNVRRCR